MGLRDYFRFKRQQEAKRFLAEEYGITVSDLRELHGALADLRALKAAQAGRQAAAMPSDEQKKDFTDKKDNAAKPEDFIKMFSDDVEEYYPNGKAKD